MFIGNIVGACWMANRGSGSVSKILIDKANGLFVLLYHPDKALHDS